MTQQGEIQLDLRAFGQYIAKRRQEVGYKTQKSLALALKKDTSTIGKLETGDRLPSFELFFELAKLLKIHPVALLRELVQPSQPEADVEQIAELVAGLSSQTRAHLKDYVTFLLSQAQGR